MTCLFILFTLFIRASIYLGKDSQINQWSSISAVHFKSAWTFSLNVGMTSSSVVGLGDGDGFGLDSSMDLDKADGRVTDDKASENLPAKEQRVVNKATLEANGVPSSGGTAQDGVTGKHGSSTTHKGHRRRRHARGRVQLKKGICWPDNY